MTAPRLSVLTTAARAAADEQFGVRGLDLRLPALAAVAWAAALVALLAGGCVSVLGLAVGAALVVRVFFRRLRGRRTRVGLATAVTWWLAAFGVVGVATLRAEAVRANPVADLAADGAVVSVELVTTSDPLVRAGPYGDLVVVRGRAEQVTGRGAVHTVRLPVLVLAEPRWSDVPLGSRLVTSGRLSEPRDDDLAAVVSPRGPPEVLEDPGALWDGAAAVRAGMREAVAGQPVGPRTLVPALVAGDDAGMPAEITEAFEVTGLTHLLAVSGTNLTLVVGALLLLARWAGVRARGLLVVGLIGIVGFVLLARTEASVVRAAAMGTVALLAMGQHGRRHATRTLGAAVLVLLLWDPWWSVSPGFTLSVLATAGILWLAPGWRDRLQRWLPRWVAEAVSIPLAAQVACTPVVAALSSQVSLVAVATNLLAAPAVGPATVLGLAGGLLTLVWTPLGVLVATPGAWCARWIIAVAEWGAGLPTAAVPWPATAAGLAGLSVLSVALALGLGPVLGRRDAALGLGVLMVVVLLVPVPRLPTPGWPPPGWAMVACDVGQGDGLVLAAGPGEAVVVDTGPDPTAIDRCLSGLGVDRVPLVLLTHFHADHVAGLEGVLDGRRVEAIETSALSLPPYGAELVADVAAAADVPVATVSYGQTRALGELRWQVVAPDTVLGVESANDGSVVLLVEVRGVRLLLLGDQEEPSQRRLLQRVGGLDVDVVKVAHHGSADQDPELLQATSPEIAVISVGEGNDYGHPAPSLLALLRQVGAEVVRTDLEGDVAVVARDGEVMAVSR